MPSQALRLNKLALAVIAIYPALTVAAPSATSAYVTDGQNTHVEDATSEGISQVNMISCVMYAMRPDALVNQGNYIALVDKNKCDPSSRSSTSNSSSTDTGSTASKYMTATVNATRTSNNDPMRSKVWIDDNEDDGQATLIYANSSVTQASSTTNPYGQFRMDFCGKLTSGGGAACKFQGFLQGDTTGLSFYQTESSGGGGGGGGGTNTVALQLTTSGTSSGSGKLQMSNNGTSTIYTFAFNSSLFRRSDGSADQCFSRDASDPETGMSVWRYGLYNATTGARITRNSGFPIDYTSGGTTYHGFMGYYGVSLPPEVTLPNGATVSKVDYSTGSAPQKTNYTVVKTDGRLMKYTKHTRTLQSMDQIKFTTFIPADPSKQTADTFFTGAAGNTQYELYWDEASGKFKADGVMNCGSNGCQTVDLSGGEQLISASYFVNRGGVPAWSQALGGEVFIPLAGVSGSINSSQITVIYRSQDLVYPKDMPAALKCLSQCPTAASISSYFATGSIAQSPFVSSTFGNFGPTASGSVITYTTDTSTGLLKDSLGNAVTFTDKTALQQRPQYMQGIQTGRLFLSSDLASVACPAPNASKYCDFMANTIDTYYVWQTGPNNWNQFAAVKDSSGTFVSFDAPLQTNYTVPNDTTKYKEYAGKSLVLQYGGFGDLWGIPGKCVSFITNQPVSCDQQNTRYVPYFSIPFNTTTGIVTDGSNGTTTYLVKWLDREIRFAKKNLSVCSSAGLTLPTSVTLPSSSSLKDPSNSSSDVYIGDKPTVTDAPRVIQGDVKY